MFALEAVSASPQMEWTEDAASRCLHRKERCDHGCRHSSASRLLELPAKSGQVRLLCGEVGVELLSAHRQHEVGKPTRLLLCLCFPRREESSQSQRTGQGSPHQQSQPGLAPSKLRQDVPPLWDCRLQPCADGVPPDWGMPAVTRSSHGPHCDIVTRRGRAHTEKAWFAKGGNGNSEHF